MPESKPNGFSALSLFSGGGGLDLGFDRAGFRHLASYELLPVCGQTLGANRPQWQVHAGLESGDVRKVGWAPLRDCLDVLHGGPPCQPFSVAGRRRGSGDARDMWPEFVRAVLATRPRAFVAENVPGLLDARFEGYLAQSLFEPLKAYRIASFRLNSCGFGAPQNRVRVFFAGFRDEEAFAAFRIPKDTHTYQHLVSKTPLFEALHASSPKRCLGLRESLGLPEIGFDALSPTLRSGFTGPRKTTSAVNSSASLKLWAQLQIWPHGVAASRERARLFVPENRHFRLSVQDCATIQGFPASWHFAGAVYQVLGQIGNSVSPPVAYHVARAVAQALS
ncbi:MAG: DNA (cytosine-5-)-methyltransferase [Acidobacteriota bacterium]